MISRFEEIENLFNKIDLNLKDKVSIYIIGGAALMYYNIGKGYTKDIDIICKNKDEFRLFGDSLRIIGFNTRRKPITHNKLEIFEMLEKDEFRFDLFVSIVCEGFCLTEKMIQRSEKFLNLRNLTVNICSKEDIVIFKSLSPDRQNDVEDSVDLIKRGVDWDIIYKELMLQSKIAPNQKKGKDLVWYFVERMDDLEKKNIHIPIKSKVYNFYNTL